MFILKSNCTSEAEIPPGISQLSVGCSLITMNTECGIIPSLSFNLSTIDLNNLLFVSFSDLQI